MQTITVERQEFRFGEGWQAIKYDDEPFHREHLGQDCAVDIVALSPRGRLYFIEAKDYRGPRNSQEHREFVTSRALFQRIGQKVRGTVVGLLGGGVRWHERHPHLPLYARALHDPEREVHVVAWIEHDYRGTDDPARVRLSVDTRLLDREVRWLKAQTLVTNSQAARSIPGITVSDRSPRSTDGETPTGARRSSRRARRRA